MNRDEIAEAINSVAGALRVLGLADAATPMGAIEALLVSVEKVGQQIADSNETIAEANGEIAAAIYKLAEEISKK